MANRARGLGKSVAEDVNLAVLVMDGAALYATVRTFKLVAGGLRAVGPFWGIESAWVQDAAARTGLGAGSPVVYGPPAGCGRRWTRSPRSRTAAANSALAPLWRRRSWRCSSAIPPSSSSGRPWQHPRHAVASSAGAGGLWVAARRTLRTGRACGRLSWRGGNHDGRGWRISDCTQCPGRTWMAWSVRAASWAAPAGVALRAGRPAGPLTGTCRPAAGSGT